MNAQPSPDEIDDEGPTPEEQGEAVIEDVAERADLDPDDYESEVRVTDDVEAGVLDEVDAHETVCLGVSEKSRVSKILWGSLADTVVRKADSNVAMIRSEYDTRPSLTEALSERLTRETA